MRSETLVFTKHLNTLTHLLSTAPRNSSNSCSLSIASLPHSSFFFFNCIQEAFVVEAAIAADVADETTDAVPKKTAADVATVTWITSLITPASSAASTPSTNFLVAGTNLEICRREETSLTSCFSDFFIDLMLDPSLAELHPRMAI